jgi:AcrR family transcriptional regulator
MGQDNQNMVERINRRDLIIEEASRLFVEQGYAATSVRQIAEAVGCTEAALYYHFKDGKRELLQAVFEQNIPDFLYAVEACSAASSLRDFTSCFMRRMVNKTEEHMVSQLRWIFTEFPNLTDDERVLLHHKNAVFRTALKTQLLCYVQDEAEADHLAWLFMFTGFGYGQMMITLDLLSATDFDLDGFIDFLADRVGAERG